jgi:hypothetical protein
VAILLEAGFSSDELSVNAKDKFFWDVKLDLL